MLSASASEAAPEPQRGDGSQMPAIGKVHGQLMDEEMEEALMYASLVLFSVRDSSMVTGAITDEEGRFTMENVPFGRFYLTVSYVGYPRHTFNDIRISPREQEYDVGIIYLRADAAMLGEVTVEAARQLMEVGLDRRVFNVEQELTAVGGTALEVMENIPSIAVDFEGNVSLRGSTNVTVLIDGRPSTLTGLTVSEALEQIPAEMIERVEVVTNPSARYNPEGTSGIINVVLKQQRKPGYNGMVSLNAGTAGRYSGSLNLNYQVNRWNFFTNYSARLSDMESFGNSRRTIFMPGQTNFMDQDITGTMGMNSHNIQAGVDFNINKKTRLTLSSRYSNWNRSMDDLTEYLMYQDITNPNNLFMMDNETDMLHHSFSHQLFFRRTFDQRHRELNADASFSTRSMDRNQFFHQEFFDPAGRTPLDQDVWERSNMDGQNWSFTTQLDYVHPLSEQSKFETGYRIQIRELDSDFLFENYDGEANLWSRNTDRSNHFIYNEQIYAAYAMYATMLGKYSLQTGIRAEQTFVEGNQRTTDYVFSNDYLSFFPTAHIRRSFENNQNAQLSYSRRINRPHNRNINPFMRYSSEYEVSMGNPELDAEFINSLELSYTRFWNTTTINPSIFYRHTDGMITRYRYVTDTIPGMEGRDVTVTNFANLNKGVSYGAEMVVSQRLTSWWNVNATMSYFRNIIEGRGAQMHEENDSYSWSGRFMSNMSLGNGWNVQLSGFYRSPIIMLQGEMDAMYSVNAAVRKNVLNNNGTITVSLRDMFDTMRFSMYNYGDNFTMNMERWRTSRQISVGFTYRINEYDRRRDRRSGENGEDNGMDFDDFDL
ncbi:MAG: TonB-dependent receptor [Bacteroidales bacterium]|nr:TonB-dependent receptor [Bacteroidales bacterium]